MPVVMIVACSKYFSLSPFHSAIRKHHYHHTNHTNTHSFGRYYNHAIKSTTHKQASVRAYNYTENTYATREACTHAATITSLTHVWIQSQKRSQKCFCELNGCGETKAGHLRWYLIDRIIVIGFILFIGLSILMVWHRLSIIRSIPLVRVERILIKFICTRYFRIRSDAMDQHTVYEVSFRAMRLF